MFFPRAYVLRSVVVGVLLAASAFGAPSEELKPLDFGTVTEKHLWIPMRDGVRLSAYAYFPAGAGPWPVLFQQRLNTVTTDGARKATARVAEKGYVVVNVNFRGAQLSEGTWMGYRALGWGRHKDGYDSCEWLASQPWSNGRIGSFGNSQAGFAQNFLAVTQPPHLMAQYMVDTSLSLFHEGYRMGGTTRPERFKSAISKMGVPRVPGQNEQLMEEWFKHPTYDAYWMEEDSARHLDRMDVPSFIVGSWYDLMCPGTIRTFVGRQHEGGPHARGRQKLMIGPWLHGGAPKPSKVGDLHFPDNARFDVDAHMIRWFDHYLKDIDNGVTREPVVRYYVMGAAGEPGAPGNFWREAADWPIEARRTPYYLHAGGKLSPTAPDAGAGSTTYLSDPRAPATISHPGIPVTSFPGARDARPFESQPNVLTFSTEVLVEPVEWTGEVRAELFVSSTAKDTDFIVRVSDVYPDGRSILIMDAIRRARYRESFEAEILMKEGEIYSLSFDVGWLSLIFNKGHRIRVTVASTGAPFYEPNPNTGEPLTTDFPGNAVVAKNTLHFGGTRASRIIAPMNP
jgi:uncharacterized protein